VILFLSGGDKPGGIADITEVAKNNGAASTDAKMLLVVLYNREKQYEKSLETLTELHKRYPRNYMLELSGAAVHQRMGNYDLARTTYRRVIEKIETRRDGYERLEAPKVMLLLARVTMEGEHQSLPEARRIWNAVITDPRSTDTDRANAHLWLGKYLDNEGKHKEATDHYDAVLKPGLQVAQGVKDEATKYKKTPFKY
jgi:tetratricopeptide (TPR) repeat protein